MTLQLAVKIKLEKKDSGFGNPRKTGIYNMSDGAGQTPPKSGYQKRSHIGQGRVFRSI